MNLLDRLRKILKEQHISQYRFAREVGVMPTVAWKWVTAGPHHQEPKGKYRECVEDWVKAHERQP